MEKLEFKGTGGDWFVNGEKYQTIESVLPNVVVTFPTIATVNSVFRTIEESQANAKLISASPDLLEALQETNIDLNILKTNFIQIEKVDSRAEGMIETIQKWIDRNNKAIEKALK